MNRFKKLVTIVLLFIFSFSLLQVEAGYSSNENEEDIKMQENLKCFNNLKDYYEILFINKNGKIASGKIRYNSNKIFRKYKTKYNKAGKIISKALYNRVRTIEKENSKDDYYSSTDIKNKYMYMEMLEALDKNGYLGSDIEDYTNTNYCKILGKNSDLLGKIILEKVNYNTSILSRYGRTSWLKSQRGKNLNSILNTLLVEKFLTDNYLEYNKIEKKLLNLKVHLKQIL